METKDSTQLQKDELIRQIRHMTSFCTCPSYISVEQLEEFIAVLKGEK